MRKELQEVNSSITTDIDKIKVDITSLQNNLAVTKASKEKAQKEERSRRAKNDDPKPYGNRTRRSKQIKRNEASNR